MQETQYKFMALIPFWQKMAMDSFHSQKDPVAPSEMNLHPRITRQVRRPPQEYQSKLAWNLGLEEKRILDGPSWVWQVNW